MCTVCLDPLRAIDKNAVLCRSFDQERHGVLTDRIFRASGEAYRTGAATLKAVRSCGSIKSCVGPRSCAAQALRLANDIPKASVSEILPVSCAREKIRSSGYGDSEPVQVLYTYLP